MLLNVKNCLETRVCPVPGTNGLFGSLARVSCNTFDGVLWLAYLFPDKAQNTWDKLVMAAEREPVCLDVELGYMRSSQLRVLVKQERLTFSPLNEGPDYQFAGPIDSVEGPEGTCYWGADDFVIRLHEEDSAVLPHDNEWLGGVLHDLRATFWTF